MFCFAVHRHQVNTGISQNKKENEILSLFKKNIHLSSSLFYV